MTVGCFAMGLSLEEALAAVTLNARVLAGRRGRCGAASRSASEPIWWCCGRARLLDLVRVGVPAVRTVVRSGRVVVRDGRIRARMSAVLEVSELVEDLPGVAQVAARRGRARDLVQGGGGRVVRPAGPNGAGKSTTLGCITTLVRPTSGRIVVDGVDVARDPVSGQAPHRGRAPGEEPGPRPDRARGADRITAATSASRRRSARRAPTACSAQMQLTDKADAKPLDAVGRACSSALIIARAHARPARLLLDEPTTGLDPQARRLLWETCCALHRQGLTLILTTHYMEEADRLCQRRGHHRPRADPDHRHARAALKTLAARRRSILDLWRAAAVAARAAAREALPGVARVEAVAASAADDGLERLRLFVATGRRPARPRAARGARRRAPTCAT